MKMINARKSIGTILFRQNECLKVLNNSESV
jgi:hypothetical protein